VTVIRKKEKHMLWGQKGKAQELLVMMVMMEMTLVVVPPHLPHKEVMSDLSLSLHDRSVHTLNLGWRPRRPDIVKNLIISEANAPVDSSGSSSQWIDDLFIPDPYTYHIPNIHSQQPTRWIYEWVDPKLYNTCYQD
jgi:hypothetical protein